MQHILADQAFKKIESFKILTMLNEYESYRIIVVVGDLLLPIKRQVFLEELEYKESYRQWSSVNVTVDHSCNEFYVEGE